MLDPLLLDIPNHIETERLFIRAPRLDDAPLIYAAIQESLDNLRQWMLWAHEEQTLESVEANSRRAIELFQTRETLRFRLFRKSDGEYVGMCEIHSFDWSVPRCEIGYWVRTSMQGNGYITEAVIGLTDFAITTLRANRFEIRCNARNRRSAAVAERAGYTLEARLHHYERDVGDELRDTLIYVKFPENPRLTS
jgi:RimJ/RimL family protein N-acetyltransferase